MKNITKHLLKKENISTIVTTGAQKDDSDLQVVSDNFQFVMWTIIAIIAVTIAMKMTRKSKINIFIYYFYYENKNKNE